jgi:hypothetical protein
MTTDILGAGTGSGAGDGLGTTAASARKLGEALPEEQRLALAIMTAGKPIREAAEAVGVHRGTVYRWIKSDPQFRAAYNARQLEQRESCRARLLRGAEDAVGRILECVGSDSKLAFALAKELGFFKAPNSQAIDPKQAQHEIVLERWEEEAQLDRRMLEQTSARKNRRLLEVDLEEELSLEIGTAGKEDVAQAAINDKKS